MTMAVREPFHPKAGLWQDAADHGGNEDAMRSAICIFALLILIGCSSTPPQAPAAAAAAPSASPPPVAGAGSKSDEAALDARFAEAVKDYEIVQKNGQQLYCRDATPTGSHVGRTVCLTETQLRSKLMSAAGGSTIRRTGIDRCPQGGMNCGS